MKRTAILIAALAAVFASPIAFAACTTNTISTSDGRTVICTVCCTGGTSSGLKVKVERLNVAFLG